MNKQILVLPGAFQTVSNYGGYDGVDIWLKKNESKDIETADVILAHSMGVNFLFAQPRPHNEKMILVNPLVKRRSFLSLVVRDAAYLFSKDFHFVKTVPASKWPFNLLQSYRLSKIDILPALKSIPKENIVIIRGKNDRFFCDVETAELIKSEGFTLIEADAGHNWNENIAHAVRKMIDGPLSI